MTGENGRICLYHLEEKRSTRQRLRFFQSARRARVFLISVLLNRRKPPFPYIFPA